MSDHMPPDPLAQMDQALRGAKDSARLTYAVYEALLESGFDEDQAFALTMSWYEQSVGLDR